MELALPASSCWSLRLHCCLGTWHFCEYGVGCLVISLLTYFLSSRSSILTCVTFKAIEGNYGSTMFNFFPGFL